MPIFNRANTVKETIDSVLSQTYFDFELIIVDDFSNDYEELKSLINDYNDTRIKLLRLPEKGNGAIARNYGVKNAESHIICFIDSDDRWLPNKLNDQIRYFELNTVITSLSNILHIRNGVEVKETKIISTDPGNIEIINDPIDALFKGLTSKLLFQTSTLMMSKELFYKAGGFDPMLARHQDYQILVSLKNAGANFIKLNTFTNVYVKDNKNSIMSKGWSIERSEAFLVKYLGSYSKEIKSNFMVIQLLGPTIKTNAIFNWLRLVFRLKLNIFSVLFKVFIFICKKLN